MAGYCQQIFQYSGQLLPHYFALILRAHKVAVGQLAFITANPYRKWYRLAWCRITSASPVGHPISCSFLAFMACPWSAIVHHHQPALKKRLLVIRVPQYSCHVPHRISRSSFAFMQWGWEPACIRHVGSVKKSKSYSKLPA